MKDYKNKIKNCQKEYQNLVLDKTLVDSHTINKKDKV